MSERDAGTVGFIGLGRMGSAIAGNLRAAGHPLVVWNRTAGKAAALVAAGAEEARTPADACRPGGVVFTMLADDAALDEVVSSDGFLERLAPRGIHVSMSTVAPATNRRLAERHTKAGSVLVAAPVFGRPEAAAAKKLWICVSGAAPSKDRILPLLGEIGQGTYEFGEEPGAASVAKLCGNFLIAAAMEAMAEAFTLGAKSGLAPADLAKLFGETLFSSPVYQNYGKAIAEGKFQPAGFALKLGLKDLRLVLGAAGEVNTPMPLADLVHGRLLSGVARGRAEYDWGALALGAAEDAGILEKRGGLEGNG